MAVWNLLRQLGHWLESWLTVRPVASYGLSVARIGFGLCGIGFLASNWTTRYYSFGSGIPWSGERLLPVSDFPKIPLFSLFYNISLNDGAFTTAYVGLGVLALLVVLGWRMKIVLPVYFVMWVSIAKVTDFLGDQGDNIYRIALIAFLFADLSAHWSLDARRRAKFQHLYDQKSWLWRSWHGAKMAPAWLNNMAQNLVLVVITCQVSFIYVSGALYKAGGAPWSGGDAIYYPLEVARFGTWPDLSNLITSSSFVVAVLTYGALLTQLSFPFLLLNKWSRKFGIIAISGVHVGIGVLMGLPWFSLTMIALDSMFVSDRTWMFVGAWFRGIGGTFLEGAGSKLADKPVVARRLESSPLPVLLAQEK